MRKTIFSFVFLLVFVSCETGEENPPGDPMPLVLGNYWLYEAEGPDSTYHVLDTLADTLNFSGYHAYLLWHRTPDGTDTVFAYYDDEGYLVWADVGVSDTLFTRVAKRDMAPGDTWSTWPGSPVIMRVGERETLHLSAGDFEALPVMMSTGTDTMAIHWFSFGAGRVQHLDFGGFYHRLVEYKLN
ncbi:MAG: hypothetical protein ABIM74_09320 [candidate division WOR-3 bacterium]